MNAHQARTVASWMARLMLAFRHARDTGDEAQFREIVAEIPDHERALGLMLGWLDELGELTYGSSRAWRRHLAGMMRDG